MNPESATGKVSQASENKKKKARCASLFKKGAELNSLQKVEVLIVLYDPLKNEFSHYSSCDPKEIFFGLLRRQEGELECSAPLSLPEVSARQKDAPRKAQKKREASPAFCLKDLLSAPSQWPQAPLTRTSPLAQTTDYAKPSKAGASHSSFDFEACSTKESSNWDLYRGGAPRPPSPTNISHYSGSTPEHKRPEEDAQSQTSRSQEDWIDQL